MKTFSESFAISAQMKSFIEYSSKGEKHLIRFPGTLSTQPPHLDINSKSNITESVFIHCYNP